MDWLEILWIPCEFTNLEGLELAQGTQSRTVAHSNTPLIRHRNFCHVFREDHLCHLENWLVDSTKTVCKSNNFISQVFSRWKSKIWYLFSYLGATSRLSKLRFFDSFLIKHFTCGITEKFMKKNKINFWLKDFTTIWQENEHDFMMPKFRESLQARTPG